MKPINPVSKTIGIIVGCLILSVAGLGAIWLIIKLIQAIIAIL